MDLLKNIDEVRLSDIEGLIGNVREVKSLDFKRMIKIDTDAEKEEFLADLSSFANSIGGHIIYGVEEEEGLAKNI